MNFCLEQCSHHGKDQNCGRKMAKSLVLHLKTINAEEHQWIEAATEAWKKLLNIFEAI